MAEWNALMNLPNAGEAFTNAYTRARQMKQQEAMQREEMDARREDRGLRREEIDHRRTEREREARAQQLQQAREQIQITARLLGSVSDEASYQRARQAAAGMGLDVSRVPPTFDPNWIAQTKMQADALSGQIERELMAVAPGTAVIDKRTGKPVYQNPRAPRYIPVPPGGKLVLDPSSVPGAIGESGALPGSFGGDDDEWEIIGGPTPQASGGFRP